MSLSLHFGTVLVSGLNWGYGESDHSTLRGRAWSLGRDKLVSEIWGYRQCSPLNMESFLGWELENEEKRTEKGRVAQGLLAKEQGLGMGLGFAFRHTAIPGEIGNAFEARLQACPDR